MVFTLDKQQQANMTVGTVVKDVEALERLFADSMSFGQDVDSTKTVETSKVILNSFSMIGDKTEVSLDEILSLKDRSVMGIYNHFKNKTGVDPKEIKQAGVEVFLDEEGDQTDVFTVKVDEDIFTQMEEGQTLSNLIIWSSDETKG